MSDKLTRDEEIRIAAAKIIFDNFEGSNVEWYFAQTIRLERYIKTGHSRSV